MTAAGQAPVRVALVEDHVALRRGLEMLLAREGFEIVGVAGDVDDGERLVRAERPDVAVVDLNMPGGGGVELSGRLLRADPDLGVLIYTGAEDVATLTEALDSGARGFALKTGPPSELRKAIRAVAAGDGYVDPGVRELILSRSTTDRLSVLSPREREVLEQLAGGLNGEQVAAQLFLSPETVRTHVRNAMDKLEARTRVHAIAIALRQGEIGLDSP